jgi:2-oxoisovalerate dehydrogenase E1 component
MKSSTLHNSPPTPPDGSPEATAPGQGPAGQVPALLPLYEQMLLLRLFELAVQEQYKAGRMPGFVHLYIGQEAVATGVCAHLRRDDWITSTHRGHGHALAKGVAPEVVMAELYGKATGCNGGRGGSMHLYDAAAGLFGTNGFVGGGLPATVGLGLSAQVRGTNQVAVAFFGDGAVNHGAFHESINLAAALSAPVVFVCENNLYATATPFSQATKNIDVSSRAQAYGIPGDWVDGNDVAAVSEAARAAIERARAGGGPTLIEARTYRTVGHHEGDQLVGTYRTQEELDKWKALDPIARVRVQLLEGKAASEEQLDAIEAKVREQVRDAVQKAESAPLPDPATSDDHVWAAPLAAPQVLVGGETRVQSWLDAVRDGIAEEMRRDENIIYVGEGIGERGGSFAHTKGLWAEFGARRVLDTPICELGFTGACIGASATGCPAIADLMFTDFVFEAASQLIEQAAKLRYMTNGRLGVPMVVRSGMGAIKNAGPHHSGTYYPLWSHCPGLLVAVPSNAADAKGLWKTALRSGDPVLMMEHKMLFASKGPVPLGEHLVPFGRAAIARTGGDLTLVSCGLLLHRCVEAAELLQNEGVSCEVIDLRTIVPLDVETIVQSVSKTGRLLVVDEAFSMCGLGAEIAACLMEHAFDELDAPMGRLHTDPVAQPFSPSLENAVVVSVQKIVEAARQVLAGRAPAQKRAPIAPLASGERAASTSTSTSNGASSGAVSMATVDKSAQAVAGDMNDAQLDAAVAPTQGASTQGASEGASNGASGGVPLLMPNQDLTISEGTVVAWLKSVGDAVKKGEALVEVETAKSVLEVESPVDGVLSQISAQPQDTVALGAALGVIEPA